MHTLLCIVQCGDLSALTAITLSPYFISWVNTALPLVPPALDAFLAAPVPYIAGVLHAPAAGAFLAAQVLYIAGVLHAPAAGYEEGVVVVNVEADTVSGTEPIPRSRALEDLEAKLAPPHEHLTMLVPENQVDPEIAREVIDGMLLIMQNQ
ncbi:hypothetical protein T484DRAFT_1824761, partial [Baffinella frigidus]